MKEGSECFVIRDISPNKQHSLNEVAVNVSGKSVA